MLPTLDTKHHARAGITARNGKKRSTPDEALRQEIVERYDMAQVRRDMKSLATTKVFNATTHRKVYVSNLVVRRRCAKLDIYEANSD